MKFYGVMVKAILIIFVAMVVLIPTASHAETGLMGKSEVFGGLSLKSLSFDDNSDDLDISTWGVGYGYWINDSFELGVEYDAFNLESGGDNAGVSFFMLTGAFYFPTEAGFPYLKLALGRVTAEGTSDGSSSSASGQAFGFGGGFAFLVGENGFVKPEFMLTKYTIDSVDVSQTDLKLRIGVIF